MLIFAPIALVWGGWWLLSEYSLMTLINKPEELPEGLKRLLGIPLMFLIPAFAYYIHIWMKRKGNPKSYPIDEDYQPSEARNIGALWGTALSGRNFRVSDSSRNKGEVFVPNE